MNNVAPSVADGHGEFIRPQASDIARLQRIPAELRQRPQWVVAGADKVPCRATGGPASVADPTTWTDFDTACRAAVAIGALPGFVLTATDPLCCIDLDVKPGTMAEQLERHESIVSTLDSYTELSRSGVGRHIWVKGDIGVGCKRDGVEVYSQGRFIICTGDVARDRPIMDRQAIVLNMVSRMRPAATAAVDLRLDDPDDDQDWYIAQTAYDDAGKMGGLFRSPWQKTEQYGSQSETDMALMLMLARLTDSNGACRGAFRLSALGKREKATKDDRYLNLTLGKVRPIVAEEAFHADEGRQIAQGMFWPTPPPKGRLRLLVDDDLDRLPALRWLVKGIIPDAGIGAIYGDSGTFKSFLALDLLTHVANGQEWFGRRVRLAPAAYLPFEGQGGVPGRIRAWRLAVTMRRDPAALFAAEPDADVRSRVAVVMEPINLRLAPDRDELVAKLTDEGWAGGVLCIDTLAHASAGIDENSSAMGEMLGIFRDLQQRLGGVILLIHHSGKDQSRGMRGWSGLHAAMDFVIECKRVGEDGSRDAQFQLAKVKDGSSGTAYPFAMREVALGFDEDGDAITSLTVAADQGEPARKPDEAETATGDDDFVDAWVRRLMSEGRQPTCRWLDAQRVHVRDQRNLTQRRLRDAIDRLKGVGRLEDTPGGPSGAKWLRAVDVLAVKK